MVTPVKKVPIHLQSAQNRLIIKNGTVVNSDKEEQLDIYIEVSIIIIFIVIIVAMRCCKSDKQI